MISVEIDSEPDSMWNKRLQNSEEGSIYQTKEYGLTLSEVQEAPLFIKFLTSNGEIVGQILISTYSRLTKKGILKKFIGKTLFLNKPVFRWTYGPIIFNDNFNSEIMQTLNNLLRSKKGLIYGTMHPFSKLNNSPLNYFKNQLWGTFLIDLRKTEQELFKKIENHNAKKNIKRSLKKGVEIEEITYDSLHEYHDLINKMRESDGKPKTEFHIFQNLWKVLKPAGYSGFLAKKDNVVLGGLLFSCFNGYIIEGGVARSSFDTKNHYYSQDLIKWNIIKWGAENNMKFFDLAGINPNPQTETEKGIFRYKKKWGGQLFNYWMIK